MSLTPRDDARRLDSPPLQGRGRGWGVSANAIARLHAHAGDMRRNPTEPEKRLWARLSRAQLGGFKFRRQATGLIVEVDGDAHADAAKDARRDAALVRQGYRVVRVTNLDVMRNMDGVLQLLLATLATMPARRAPHPNPSPEGEGLSGS